MVLFPLMYGLGFVNCAANINRSYVLHVSMFPVNLLFVSAFTEVLNCKTEVFFPIIMFFKTLKQGGRLTAIDCMMTYICWRGVVVLFHITHVWEEIRMSTMKLYNGIYS
ncbi:hypothetical protein ES288_A02G140900v1 [Gossypium darwinii]|uniref:Uncharacterized protein n=1 Tax=Gossypium darwinii TaxID=34276 RepID=A0A5D2HE35_GOSDA|nr:hypothetical protein ES288_A02G140900v1 [Gossypium darwinii]